MEQKVVLALAERNHSAEAQRMAHIKQNRSLENYNGTLPFWRISPAKINKETGIVQETGRALSFIDYVFSLPSGSRILIYDDVIHQRALAELDEALKMESIAKEKRGECKGWSIKISHTNDLLTLFEMLNQARFGKHKFDCIATLQAFTNSPEDPMEIWKEMFGALREGGMLFLDSINLNKTPIVGKKGQNISPYALDEWFNEEGYKAQLGWSTDPALFEYLWAVMIKTEHENLELP
jgi:hypothetical protein